MHFVRDMLYHCRRDQRGLVAAALREVFNAENRDQARERVTHVIARLQAVAPKVCRLLEEAEEDLTAFYAFPPEHWTKLRSDEPARTRQQGDRPPYRRLRDLPQRRRRDPPRRRPALREDEWLVHRHYLSVESMALILSAGWTEDPSLEHQQQEVAELDPA
ncbi:MAG: transposase [Solirubrobacterales bacterium]|nr:transposase [Solirubrobacterales bacterium]